MMDVNSNITTHAKEDVKQFKAKVKQDAEQLVVNKFPQKILALDELLRKERFTVNFKRIKVDINIPVPDMIMTDQQMRSGKEKKVKSNEFGEDEEEVNVRKSWLFPLGAVLCNQHLNMLVSEIKPHILELIEDIHLLKLAINLMMPKIEDGNNFGVEIQRETLEAIVAVEEDVTGSYDTFATYFQSRGQIIAKVAKFPHCQDYRRAVQERDEKFLLTLCMTLTDIRNHYASLHDLIVKNLQKIKHPKSQSNFDAMF